MKTINEYYEEYKNTLAEDYEIGKYADISYTQKKKDFSFCYCAAQTKRIYNQVVNCISTEFKTELSLLVSPHYLGRQQVDSILFNLSKITVNKYEQKVSQLMSDIWTEVIKLSPLTFNYRHLWEDYQEVTWSYNKQALVYYNAALEDLRYKNTWDPTCLKEAGFKTVSKQHVLNWVHNKKDLIKNCKSDLYYKGQVIFGKNLIIYYNKNELVVDDFHIAPIGVLYGNPCGIPCQDLIKGENIFKILRRQARRARWEGELTNPERGEYLKRQISKRYVPKSSTSCPRLSREELWEETHEWYTAF